MVSITFFAFVAVILIVGFFAATWRRKHRIPLDPDGKAQENTERLSRASSTLKESTGDIKGGILPAENKLSQNDLNEEGEPLK